MTGAIRLRSSDVSHEVELEHPHCPIRRPVGFLLLLVVLKNLPCQQELQSAPDVRLLD
jgi:hypothetical protein